MDFERFRHRWESDEHWSMRREFILQHRDRFPEDRLLCLAQTFANMEMLGCVYPAAVAEFVRELAKDVPRPERLSVPPVAPVIFVRGSATPPHEPSSETPVVPAQSFVVGVRNEAGRGCEPCKRSSSPDVDPSSAAKVLRKSADEPPGKAPSASSGAPSTAGPTDSTQLSKFEAVMQLMKECVITSSDCLDVMQQAFTICGFKLNFDVRQAVECVVRVDGETLAIASAANKKKAKHLALKSVWDKFASICPSLPKDVHTPVERERISGKAAKKNSVKGKRARSSSVPKGASKAAKKRSVKSRGTPQNSVPTSANTSTECKLIGKATKKSSVNSKPADQSFAVADGGALDLEKIVVVEASNSPCDAMSTLKITASRNKLRGRFDFESSATGFVCTYVLGQHKIMEGTGKTKKEAKQNAASASLTHLQSIAPTLRVKQFVDEDGPRLTKNMFGGPEEISSENIGHKLLKMMGWTGGGMGKEGSGIVDPVVLKETCGRQGLGFSRRSLGFSECSAQVNKNFKAKVDQVLLEFSHTVVLEDLVFSPEFTNEERKYIHSVALKHRLRSKSVNGPSGRFLTVGHKISARELVDRILASGRTEKYEVLMPGQVNGATEN